MHIMERAGGAKHEFELQMLRADASISYTHLNCLRREPPDAPPMQQLALVDIGNLKLAEHGPAG